MVVRAVGLGPTMEVVALDVAGEALALGGPGDVDQVALGEQVGHPDLLAHAVAIEGVGVDPELADPGHFGQVLELAGLGLDQPAAGLGAQLDGRVAVALVGAQASHGVRLHGDHADGNHRPVGLKELV